ncbi:DNA damage-inducible protein 1 [Elasticomyces elasticus]|uniref:DNA damage-inducible protein 1 n=1 Tax=Exophiala sideris TaxID=1016849 RepID=A0ABR0JH03_9EURO|nr:DNA damage-inducible protein 1 [Elasticomyces elasticus]KAK5033395.1 DNA damage-inducible protein 1 [Exophiala sideris]KAK5042110.1 DNA damage-inducible protein 1 [Exophiala sideris]KAK5063939.1 DNA damage-inducible protein 1 [Exophiala sideris]KAK5185378.1 DNA damage-inducible protein 1 [Eurotiomycetes sp. CCFEE 6388]
MTLSDIKAFIEAEINVPPSSQIFLQDGRPVTDKSTTLAQMNVQEGDVVALAIQSPRQRSQPAQRSTPAQPAQRAPSANDPEQARLRVLGDPVLMAEWRRQDPELASAASDRDKFHDLYSARQRQYAQAQREKEEQHALLAADPFNVDAQQKIEEMIRQERVAENLQKAMEENPESFGRVTMLYIDVTVNNVPIKAFVDSGAQTTIMSPAAAERCGILRLIDKRFGGIARGVGTANILGRVHSAEIQIGQYNLASSFTVMEGKDVDLLLGLDMLKRHQMCIDLRKNSLIVQNDEIPFLPESEIPKMMDDILKNEPKVEGPDGSTIGTTTGTLEPGTGSSTSQQQEAGPSGTSGQASSSQSAGGAGNFGQSQPITPESIAKITELGFSREEAIAALRQVDGNVELAIGLLI